MRSDPVCGHLRSERPCVTSACLLARLRSLHCTDSPHNLPPLPLPPATCMAGAGGAYTAANLRNDCILKIELSRSLDLTLLSATARQFPYSHEK